MSFETIHVEKICRTCLSEEGDMRSIYSTHESSGKTMLLVEMLMSCAAVQVHENDGLPNQICLQCVHQLTQAFSFKQLCERSNTTLRQILRKPMYASVMELKLLVVTETHEPACSGDIINTVTDSVQAVADTVQTVTDTVQTVTDIESEVLSSAVDPLHISSNHINETFKAEDSQDLESKLEYVDNDITEMVPDSCGNDTDNKYNFQEMGVIDETEQPIYPCEECTQCFTTMIDLTAHAKTHTKTGRYVCQICNQAFTIVSSLDRHMKIHAGAKTYLCSECGKSFARSDYLTLHIRTHTGEKPFLCKLCGKSFAYSSNLLEHTRAHENEKSFICSTCGKAFARRTGLAAHNKTHTGIKSHACGVCGKRLCGSGSLHMHMKTHTGLKDHICSYCGKGFTSRCNLLSHERTHRGKRRYACNECGKSFSNPSRLTAHARSHSGEKTDCDRGLQKHARVRSRGKTVPVP